MDDAPERQDSPNRWLTLVAVCLGTFMLLLDITIVNVALPDIQMALTASFSDLQWVVDAYALTLAALLLTTGSLADLFGRRRLYVIGLVIFTLASLLCGLATTSLFLELARGAQGVGGAIMFSVSLALLAATFEGKDRGVAFGIWGAITGLAVAVGPLLGGVLTSGLSWRWIFFVNLPLGAVAVAITLAKVQESRAEHARRPDWWGVLTFTAALAALVYALIESNQRSFGDTRVVACFVAAAVLLVAFLLIERFGRHPMFDLGLFRMPTFSGGLIAAFGISASIFSLLLYLVLYIQDLLGYSPLQTGIRVLVLSGGIRHNPLWLHVLAEVLGRPFETAESDNLTLRSGAVQAAYAAGVVDDLAAGSRVFAPVTRTVTPEGRHAATYDEAYARYRDVTTALTPHLHALAEGSTRARDAKDVG